GGRWGRGVDVAGEGRSRFPREVAPSGSGAGGGGKNQRKSVPDPRPAAGRGSAAGTGRERTGESTARSTCRGRPRREASIHRVRAVRTAGIPVRVAGTPPRNHGRVPRSRSLRPRGRLDRRGDEGQPGVGPGTEGVHARADGAVAPETSGPGDAAGRVWVEGGLHPRHGASKLAVERARNRPARPVGESERELGPPGRLAQGRG